MTYSASRIVVLLICLLWVSVTSAQDSTVISADNLGRLQSDEQIDFEDLAGELNFGWFAANEDASEIVASDQRGTMYIIMSEGLSRSWSYVNDASEQVFSLIAAVFLDGDLYILYQLDAAYYIIEGALLLQQTPVGLWSLPNSQSLVVGTIDNDGVLEFQHYEVRNSGSQFAFVETFDYPSFDSDAPAVRIGRIGFPLVLVSVFSDNRLLVYRYPDAYTEGREREIRLINGPAIVGAVNGTVGSHFAWSDPHSMHLNLLNLATGDNRVVAELEGAYAQFHLLTLDASAVIIVNLNFTPEVFAWESESGRRYDLGPYRRCSRIPDKVALSADGTALIIGCDTGLDIWRIGAKQED